MTEQTLMQSLPQDIALAIVSKAIMDSEYVARLAPASFQNQLSENIFGARDIPSRGIRFSESDKGLSIDISIDVHFGVRIPELAWILQKSIQNELLSELGIQVSSVNISVMGVVI